MIDIKHLIEVYKNMNRFNLIMVSAAMEQGGNLFLRFLDSHPKLLCYPFESQMGTRLSESCLDIYLGKRYRYPVFNSEWTREQIYDEIIDEELKTYLKIPNRSKFRNCGIKMDESKRKNLFIKYFGESDESDIRKSAIAAYFKSTFDAWEGYNFSGEETHYVGYNPTILLEADEFFKDFPNGKMIHVIRNPFSGYSDTLKRPYHLSLKAYCDIWNICQLKAASLLQKYPNNFFIIKNEDYIRDSEKIIGKLLGKIDIPSSSILSYPSFNGKKLDNLMPWGAVEYPNEKYNKLKAKQLSNEDLVSIYDECCAMIKYFEYEDLAFDYYYN